MSEEKRANVFGRIGRSVKNMRGEMSRVVWPSRKQVFNNTGVVLIFMGIAAIIIGGFDLIMAELVRRALGA